MPPLPARLDDAGTTLVEYALLLALVAGLVVGSAGSLGSSVTGSMDRTCQALAGDRARSVPGENGRGRGLDAAPGLDNAQGRGRSGRSSQPC